VRPRGRIVLGAALICLGVAAWQGARLVVALRWNRLIESGHVRGDVARAPPEVRFAAAYASAQSGAVQEALDAYRALLVDAAPRLRHDAMFNAGNLYLQRAMAARAMTDQAASLTLAELAKASYRDLIREDSSDWDARYNLEKTLRLAPDAEGDDEALYTPPTHLRAAPTAPGTSLGLP